MRVEVWCRPLAVRVGAPKGRVLVGGWEDAVSTSPETAALRAVELTNSHPEKLDGWMAVTRREWDSVAGGLAVGVGDAVVAGGACFERVVGGGLVAISRP
jgi:hypothetical protein